MARRLCGAVEKPNLCRPYSLGKPIFDIDFSLVRARLGLAVPEMRAMPLILASAPVPPTNRSNDQGGEIARLRLLRRNQRTPGEEFLLPFITGASLPG